MICRKVLSLIVTCLACLPAFGLAEDVIWIEGEKPAKSSFRKHGWYDDVKKDVMSGGNWLSHYAGQPGEASYKVEIPQDGSYTFWVRCNNLYVTQHYKLDTGDWVACDLKTEPREQMMISPRPDHRNLAWHKLGKLDLKAGSHTISFRLSSKTQNHGGIDCFALASGSFVPSGARKPGSLKPAGPADWFEVTPDDDAFSPQSIIDMTHLLHTPAGKFGFVQRQADKLTVGGKPIKFWGCGANMQRDKSRAWQEQWIKYLAKHGVNMVRQHTVEHQLGPLVRKDGKLAFDPQRLDQWDWWCAKLKEHGIYMTWSICYPHPVSQDEGYELFEDLPPYHNRKDLRSTSGLVPLSKALQDSEWRYVKLLLEHKNKYTGVRYIDEPALAVVEIHNEDSIFWHAPLNDLANGKRFPKHAALMKAGFAVWLKKKYGTDEQLRQAWGRGFRGGDSVNNKNMPVYGAWQMASAGPAQRPAHEAKRMGDFIQYLAELQRNYYDQREQRLRDLGFKAVSVTTAWRAGGPAADPANLWTDDAMSMIDRHNYFGGGDGGHSVKAGKVKNGTHLGQPGQGILSLGLYQVEDKPFSVTEWTQLPPNQWKAEIAPLMAFYGLGLQGWDASYHFLSSRNRMGAGWPNLSSYVTDTPHFIGQFPALAFALHKGHITEAPLAAARRVKMNDLFAGVDPLGQDFTGGGYDDKQLKGSLSTPAEVLAIGRVTAKFGDNMKPSTKIDWAQHWDKQAKVVRSATGQLAWDYGKRIVTVNTDQTQAVIGFAGGSTQKLKSVTVADIKTPFVSLIFTPLDDKPLAASGHILITAMAQDKQTGTEYNADGTQLVTARGPPLLMEPVQATITLAGAAPKSVRAVDLYGVPTDQQVAHSGKSFVIDGRFRAYYYEVKR